VIRGLDELERSGVLVFHAGTSWNGSAWDVRGGRAAYLTATAASLEEARAKLVRARAALSGEGWRSRGDIAVVSAPAMRPS
jgi:phosphoribosylamine-glycine ligase